MKKLIVLVLLIFAINNNVKAVDVLDVLRTVVIIEGFYDSLTNQYLRSDSLFVNLHDYSSPYGLIVSRFVKNDSATFYGQASYNVANGDYYIVVKHRNSLETWSNWGTSIGGSFHIFSFINRAEAAWGDNQVQVDNAPLRFAIYSGDVNQDGTIDGVDVSIVDNDAQNFVTGYKVVTDLNFDEVVDAADVAIADRNASNFISLQRPVAP